MSDPGCTVVDDRITKRLLYAVDGADPRRTLLVPLATNRASAEPSFRGPTGTTR